MRKVSGAVGAAVLLSSILISAQAGQSVPTSGNERSTAWFVELSSPPAVEGSSVATLDGEEAAFHNSAAAAGVNYTRGRSFRKLWNGITVGASPSDVAKIRGLSGVRAVYPVANVTVAQAQTPGPPVADLITALAMTGADIAQETLGFTGRGVTVAVIDTGIDYDHPDLGGCFGPGCRVSKGFDFVGDAYNNDITSPAYNPIPTPDPFPDDCNGHGTHVSGIVGANGQLKGVAPEVTFHAYRVFGCNGSTSADIMLAAMEQAMDDGTDVVNMSIGSALAWPNYPTSQGADRLVKHGIVVVASIGNEGALGLYAAAAPGNGKDVIGVASFDNTHANLTAFSITPDNMLIGYIEAAGAPPPPVTGSFPMARTGTTTTANDACNPLAPGSLTGKVALIRRGTCGFYQKAFNAQTAGAAGVVLYNNVAGFISPTVAGAPPITIPVVSITAARGALIDGRLQSGPVTLTWTSQIASEPNPTANLISTFSSYGLPPDLSLKPDLGAPGGTVRSTLPLEQGGYGNLSGTSMSSPHVAGAVALLLQASPKTRPDEVMARLRNTARPHLWAGNPALGFLDNVHRQGAGMLRIDDAIETDALVTPSKLALGEIESGSITEKIEITLDDTHGHRGKGGHANDDAVTYTLGHEAALATGPNTFAPQFLAAFATVAFSKNTVTLGGSAHHNDASIRVTITPPSVPAARLFGGYITLTPDDGSPVLRVPYSGYNGDYQAITVLVPTPNGFPWLAKLVGNSFFNQPSGASYTMAGNDVPFFLVHFDHQVQLLAMEIIDVSNGASQGFADLEEFLIRNSAPTSFFAVPWDGTSIKKIGGKLKTLPNGAYRIELSVLKALGDPDNPAHTEHWTSPNIVIARP